MSKKFELSECPWIRLHHVQLGNRKNVYGYFVDRQWHLIEKVQFGWNECAPFDISPSYSKMTKKKIPKFVMPYTGTYTNLYKEWDKIEEAKRVDSDLCQAYVHLKGETNWEKFDHKTKEMKKTELLNGDGDRCCPGRWINARLPGQIPNVIYAKSGRKGARVVNVVCTRKIKQFQPYTAAYGVSYNHKLAELRLDETLYHAEHYPYEPLSRDDKSTKSVVEYFLALEKRERERNPGKDAPTDWTSPFALEAKNPDDYVNEEETADEDEEADDAGAVTLHSKASVTATTADEEEDAAPYPNTGARSTIPTLSGRRRSMRKTEAATRAVANTAKEAITEEDNGGSLEKQPEFVDKSASSLASTPRGGGRAFAPRLRQAVVSSRSRIHAHPLKYSAALALKATLSATPPSTRMLRHVRELEAEARTVTNTAKEDEVSSRKRKQVRATKYSAILAFKPTLNAAPPSAGIHRSMRKAEAAAKAVANTANEAATQEDDDGGKLEVEPVALAPSAPSLASALPGDGGTMASTFQLAPDPSGNSNHVTQCAAVAPIPASRACVSLALNPPASDAKPTVWWQAPSALITATWGALSPCSPFIAPCSGYAWATVKQSGAVGGWGRKDPKVPTSLLASLAAGAITSPISLPENALFSAIPQFRYRDTAPDKKYDEPSPNIKLTSIDQLPDSIAHVPMQHPLQVWYRKNKARYDAAVSESVWCSDPLEKLKADVFWEIFYRLMGTSKKTDRQCIRNKLRFGKWPDRKTFNRAVDSMVQKFPKHSDLLRG